MNPKIEELIQHGRLKEALQKIEEFGPMHEVEGKILASRVYQIMGNYDKAYHLAAEALALSIDQGWGVKELGARVALSYILVRMNRYDECRIAINQAKQFLSDLEHDDYHQVRKYEATLLNIEGLLSRYLGNLDQALEYYKKSYGIRSKLDILADMASSLTNIGTVYQIKGQLDTALEYHHRAKEKFQKLDNQLLLAFTYHDLGAIYWEQNNFDNAVTYYEKALRIRIKHNHQQNIGKTLLELILLYLEFDRPETSKYYFEMLTELYNDHSTMMIKNYHDLAQAMIFKNSPRLIKRAEALQLLESLLDRSIPSDFKVEVMLNLCDLYILDLKLSKNEKVIEQVEDLISELIRIAKQQHSISLHIEVIILQSQFSLFKLDLQTAQHLLFQAELRANKHGLHHLAMKASAEHDDLVNKLHKWEKMRKKNSSLIERLNEINLSDSINDLRLRRKGDDVNRKMESPLFLLILNEDLVTVYSTTFNDQVEINEDLIGSFLMASDMGIGLALHTEGKIERIKYGDHQLIFIHHDKLIFCYAFEGQSYFAIKRLQDFIDRIRLGRSWQLLSASVPRPKLIKKDLSSKISDYFSPTGIFSQQLFN